jgi:general secretion pathway protein H
VGIVSGDRELEREADRLQALLNLALEDAVLEGRELGVRFYPAAYEFSALDPDENRWEVIAGDPLLQERQLSPDVELLVTIEGHELDLEESRELRDKQLSATEEETQSDEASAYRPQVFLFSSGDLMPPFTVELRRRFGDLRLTLEVAEDGSVEVTRAAF